MLLNKSETRKFIFKRLEVLRPALVKKLERVSSGSFEWLEARLQNIIDDELRQHGTNGKTINLGKQ